MVRTCHNCSKEIPEDVRFCPHCGSRVFSVVSGDGGRQRREFEWPWRGMRWRGWQTRQSLLVLIASVIGMPVAFILFALVFLRSLAVATLTGGSGAVTVFLVVFLILYFAVVGYWFVHSVEVPWWWAIGVSIVVNVVGGWFISLITGNSSGVDYGFFFDWALPASACAVGGLLATSGGRRTPWQRWD